MKAWNPMQVKFVGNVAQIVKMVNGYSQVRPF